MGLHMSEPEAALEYVGGVIRVGVSSQHRAELQSRAKARRALRDWESLWGGTPQEAVPRSPSVGGWSAAARRRMRRRFAETDWAPVIQDGRAVMLTLTLPGSWTVVAPHPKAFAAALRRFWERWRRAYGDPQCGYVIEYQTKRGAPHLHALIRRPAGRAWIGRGKERKLVSWPIWVRHAWSESVAHPDANQRLLHLRHGVDVEAWRGDPARAAVYFSGYANGRWKGQNHPPSEWGGIGLLRVWGVRGLKRMPSTEIVLTESQRIWAIRLMRRWYRANFPQKKFPGNSSGASLLTHRAGGLMIAVARAVKDR